MSRYAPERTADGSMTLRNLELDQACNSSYGAWAEARERYADPCRVGERAQTEAVLRVLDIGTGPGWNVAALLAATHGSDCCVEVTSLELDRNVFELGERCVEADESAGGLWLARAREALRRSDERDGALVPWPDVNPTGGVRFQFGDARESVAAFGSGERFDVVFLDPFSPASAPDLWQPEFLTRIAEHMASGALLSTYTTSLAVRANLLAAGLAVGPGPRVGPKHAGTLAGRDQVFEPFDERTVRKLARKLAQSTPQPPHRQS